MLRGAHKIFLMIQVVICNFKLDLILDAVIAYNRSLIFTEVYAHLLTRINPLVRAKKSTHLIKTVGCNRSSVSPIYASKFLGQIANYSLRSAVNIPINITLIH